MTERAPYEFLLVEDNPADAMLMEMALEASKIKFNLHAVADGQAALDYLFPPGGGASPRPDVILLDLNLPRVSGLTVLQTVKADPEVRNTLVIVLTSSDAPVDVRACYESMAHAYVCKPLHYESLVEVTERMGKWLDAIELPRDANPEASPAAT